MAYLGIDLGTSGLRALLVDAQGTPIASAEHHYAAQNPHRGWSEQDPQQWVDALDHAMMSLGAVKPAKTIFPDRSRTPAV